MWDAPISALLNSPTVSGDILRPLYIQSACPVKSGVLRLNLVTLPKFSKACDILRKLWSKIEQEGMTMNLKREHKPSHQ